MGHLGLEKQQIKKNIFICVIGDLKNIRVRENIYFDHCGLEKQQSRKNTYLGLWVTKINRAQKYVLGSLGTAKEQSAKNLLGSLGTGKTAE